VISAACGGNKGCYQLLVVAIKGVLVVAIKGAISWKWWQ